MDKKMQKLKRLTEELTNLLIELEVDSYSVNIEQKEKFNLSQVDVIKNGDEVTVSSFKYIYVKKGDTNCEDSNSWDINNGSGNIDNVNNSCGDIGHSSIEDYNRGRIVVSSSDSSSIIDNSTGAFCESESNIISDVISNTKANCECIEDTDVSQKENDTININDNDSTYSGTDNSTSSITNENTNEVFSKEELSIEDSFQKSFLSEIFGKQ